MSAKVFKLCGARSTLCPCERMSGKVLACLARAQNGTVVSCPHSVHPIRVSERIGLRNLPVRSTAADCPSNRNGQVPSRFAHSGEQWTEKSQADLGGATWDFLFNGRLQQLSDRGELGAQKRSFRHDSPTRNSHRSGATHVALADGEDGSLDNRPYRLCSSLLVES